MKSRLSFAGAVGVLLAGTAAAGAGAVYFVIRQMRKPPDNAPEEFLTHGGAPGGRVVVCLGASTVHGQVGVSFVDMLARRFSESGPQNGLTFVNAGVNGHTTYHILKRLDNVIACDPDFVVILAGGNDAICTLSPDAWKSYRGDLALARKPDLEWFGGNMRGIVRRLKEATRARIAICSLPLLGEDLSSESNATIREFNAALRQIAGEEGAAYLPVYEREEAFLAEQGHTHGRPYTGDARESLRLGFLGNVQHYLFGRSYDSISAGNGMLLKTDLVHGNSREAGIIADLVAGFLEAEEAGPGVNRPGPGS